MAGVNTRFHQYLVQSGWQWAPGIAGNSLRRGAELLDGTANQGECGYVANALAYLINAPAPYGFGVGGAEVFRYTGSKHKGFISPLANALPGLQPNINLPVGGTLNGYYFWDNHKVVKFNGRYYDPCYNTVYDYCGLMTAASLNERKQVRLRDLAKYDPYNPFTLGAFRLAFQKAQDLVFNTTHTITVFHTENVHDATVDGYYMDWSSSWKTIGDRQYWDLGFTGPLAENPLVR